MMKFQYHSKSSFAKKQGFGFVKTLNHLRNGMLIYCFTVLVLNITDFIKYFMKMENLKKK